MKTKYEYGTGASPGAARSLPPIKILHLERTSCSGASPAYKVRVDDNAEVRWNGLEAVAVPGRRIWAIPRAKLELIHNLLEDYDFMNLDKPEPGEGPFFGPNLTSMPHCIITVIFSDGTRKKIDHYLGDGFMPKRLGELEHRLDALLGTGALTGR